MHIAFTNNFITKMNERMFMKIPQAIKGVDHK